MDPAAKLTVAERSKLGDDVASAEEEKPVAWERNAVPDQVSPLQLLTGVRKRHKHRSAKRSRHQQQQPTDFTQERDALDINNQSAHSSHKNRTRGDRRSQPQDVKTVAEGTTSAPKSPLPSQEECTLPSLVSPPVGPLHRQLPPSPLRVAHHRRTWDGSLKPRQGESRAFDWGNSDRQQGSSSGDTALVTFQTTETILVAEIDSDERCASFLRHRVPRETLVSLPNWRSTDTAQSQMQYKLRALDRKIQMNKGKLAQVRERIMELGGEPSRFITPPALEAASKQLVIAGDVSIAKQKMEESSNMDSKDATGHERPERVEDAQLGTESEQHQIRTTKYHAQVGKEVISAVIVIQRALRVFRARRRLAGLVRHAYQRVLDSKSNQYFYYNRHTRLSQWETPALLRHRRFSLDDDKSIVPALPTTSQSQANPVSDAAARTIQALFRRHVLRGFLRDLNAGNLEKVFDAGFGTWYYYNVRTQRSFWENVHHVRATAANSAIYHRYFPA